MHKRPFSLPKPLPRQTAVPHPTRPSSPKPAQPTCGATAKTIALPRPLCRKRLRQPCRTAAKQNRHLPTKARTEAQKRTNQSASILRRLANAATRFLICDTWRENKQTFPRQKLRQTKQAQEQTAVSKPTPQPFAKTCANLLRENQPRPLALTAPKTLKNDWIATRLTAGITRRTAKPTPSPSKTS